MTIDDAIVTYLRTVTALTDQIGTGSSCRLYPATCEPTDVSMPYVIYAEINRIKGAAQEVQAYSKYYQFSVYSDVSDTCQLIKEALLDAFDRKPQIEYTGISLISGHLTSTNDLPYDDTLRIFGAMVMVKIDYVKS